MSQATVEGVDEYLSNVYYNPKRPGSFGGAESLYRDVKDEGRFKLSREQISNWLMKQDTYTLHAPARRHFKRNRVIVGGIDEEWQLDLADVQSLMQYNDGYRYLLVCIDVFSKYAWIVPVKSKTGTALVEAFKVILTSGRKPEKIMTDQGTEFFNSHFQNLLKSENIQLFNTFNETKASVVERVIRIFKSKMWRYFTARKTLRYVDMLPDSERLLLSYVDLKILMNRNVDEFCLMASEADADYRVKLTEVYLKIRKVKVNPSISIAHELALKKGPAIYPVRRVECKSFIIPAGNPSLRKDNLYNGLVPKTIIFGMVDSVAFNGAYKKNPFNFQNFTTSFLAISVNGEEVPFKPLQLSYTAATRRYIEAFLTLFSGTRKMFYDLGNDISRDEFVNGFNLYSADLSPDMCGSFGHFNVVQRGNLAVDIKFSTAPTVAVSLVCYGEFENTIHIDSERNVIYDYVG